MGGGTAFLVRKVLVPGSQSGTIFSEEFDFRISQIWSRKRANPCASGLSNRRLNRLRPGIVDRRSPLGGSFLWIFTHVRTSDPQWFASVAGPEIATVIFANDLGKVEAKTGWEVAGRLSARLQDPLRNNRD